MLARLAAKAWIIGSAVVPAAATTTTIATPAQAAAWGRAYPYVYLDDSNRVMVERDRSVTDGYQNIVDSRVFYAANTRDDDAAYLRDTAGGVGCVPAGNANAV